MEKDLTYGNSLRRLIGARKRRRSPDMPMTFGWWWP